MPVQVHFADDLTITATPLTAAAFRPFGDVIENPGPDVHPHTLSLSSSSGSGKFPFNAVSANQGSAIKYQHVTVPLDLYGQAPSKQPGRQVMNLFVCAARELEPESISDLFPAGNGTAYPAAAKPAGLFKVRILERHPFTTQTFIPLDADFSRRYLVVVAPSLAPSGPDLNLPVPTLNSNEGSDWHIPGGGLPDVRGLRAFIATGRQALTYGAGTWHAPMAALGEVGTAIDFVVVQSANGVALEDCQEVEYNSGPHNESSEAESGRPIQAGPSKRGIFVRLPFTNTRVMPQSRL